MLDQVNLHEHPALADLGPRYRTGAGLDLQGDWMNLEEAGGFLQVERIHGYQEQAQPFMSCVSTQTKPTFPAR